MIEKRRLRARSAIAFAVVCASIANVAGAVARCSSSITPGDFEVGGYAAYTRSVLVPDAAVASVVALTSFSPEYAISVARDDARDDRWIARYTVARKQLWSNSDMKMPLTKIQEVSLDGALAERIVRTWKHVIAHPIPEDPNVITGDGTTFIFSVDGDRAHTWTPRCGIPMLAVDTAESLRVAAMAGSRNKRARALKRMVRQLDAIEQQLSVSP